MRMLVFPLFVFSVYVSVCTCDYVNVLYVYICMYATTLSLALPTLTTKFKEKLQTVVAGATAATTMTSLPRRTKCNTIIYVIRKQNDFLIMSHRFE